MSVAIHIVYALRFLWRRRAAAICMRAGICMTKPLVAVHSCSFIVLADKSGSGCTAFLPSQCRTGLEIQCPPPLRRPTFRIVFAHPANIDTVNTLHDCLQACSKPCTVSAVVFEERMWKSGLLTGMRLDCTGLAGNRSVTWLWDCILSWSWDGDNSAEISSSAASYHATMLACITVDSFCTVLESAPRW